MDKASWNEQWMGYPVGPHYAESSNIDNAQRLRGKLLLIVGELDTNVPPESTYRFADALIKAGKDFEYLVAERDRDAARAFYQKFIDVQGMPVGDAAEVADLALQRTHAIVTRMPQQPAKP